MTEMVERVARAIWRHATLEPGEVDPEDSFERTSDYWMACARVAIAAMREPTPDMIMAGGDHKAWGRKRFGIEDYAPSGNIYTAMIDAALGAQP